MKTYTFTLTEEQHRVFELVLASFGGCEPSTEEARRPRQKSSPHKNLHRRTSPEFSGFRLSVQRKGFNFVRYFSVSKYKSWNAAEEAALAERDAIIAMTEDKSELETFRLFQDYRKHIAQA